MIEMTFDDGAADTFRIAIFIKESAMKKGMLETHYVNPLVEEFGVERDQIIALSLEYNESNKAPKTVIEPYIEDYVIPAIEELDIEYALVADGEYFKKFACIKGKAESYAGLFTRFLGTEIEATYLHNWQSLLHNPNNAQKIHRSLGAISQQLRGEYIAPGTDIIHKAYYLSDVQEAKDMLDEIMDYPHVALDIESYSLEFYDAGIATCCFCIDQHNGFVLDCDVTPATEDKETGKPIHFDYKPNYEMRKAIKQFLIDYQGKLRFYNAPYDVKVFIYTLFMEEDLGDNVNMVDAIEMLLPKLEDGKLIYYLATNNAAKNELSLKQAASAYTGAYALEDITDIRVYPLKTVREYNLIDGLATNYVIDHYTPIMEKDNQRSVHEEIFHPSLGLVLQMELHGTPINMDLVHANTKKLKQARDKVVSQLNQCEIIEQLTQLLRQEESDKKHEQWKAKTAPLDHFNYIVFNPKSPKQLQTLLYDLMELPILNRTKKGAPSVDGDTLKMLVNHADNQDDKRVLELLLEYAQIAILINNFMANFVKYSRQKPNGDWYLYGNFNLGGTLSGRLSSSSPNMQNMPGGRNKYAKLVKQCIQAPESRLFCGADFASLEDRISALTTKDPEKLKVYIDGFDGHCLRAYTYFGDEMQGINPDTVESINSIKKEYPEHRDMSKGPTFSLTYQGTYITLMRDQGFSEQKAKAIEQAFHELYWASDKWVDSRIMEARKRGYVDVAFGLRVRAPLLKGTHKQKRLNFAAEAEKRTIANALGQSYGLLNNRAGIEFQRRTFASKWRYEIMPCMHIHDAQYFDTALDLECVQWINKNLTECMAWQELPEIAHDQVKLSGELDIFYPDWTNAITLTKPDMTIDEIYEACNLEEDD